MMFLPVFLLLATSALAADLAPYTNPQPLGPSMFPVDDNTGNHLKVNPTSHLFYSFEQTRLDGPPQVDIRDEEIGQYMNKDKTTTEASETTTASVITLSISDDDTRAFGEIPAFNEIQPNLRYPPVDTEHRWRLPSSPPLPPTTPNWEELARDPLKQSGAPSTNSPVQQITETKTEEVVMPALPTFAPIVVLPTRRTTIPQPKPIVHSWHETQNHGANRGNHKFNWDDVKLPPQIIVEQKVETHVTHAPTTSYPPPPTLSPWSGDNLG